MNSLNTSTPHHFPKIFRFITEQGKLGIIGFSSLVVVIGIFFQVNKLNENRTRLGMIQNQRVQLTKELQYWQDVARQYTNYRDVYFRIASLQYELGQPTQAQGSLQKVLALDPNFQEGKVLADKMKAN